MLETIYDIFALTIILRIKHTFSGLIKTVNYAQVEPIQKELEVSRWHHKSYCGVIVRVLIMWLDKPLSYEQCVDCLFGIVHKFDVN